MIQLKELTKNYNETAAIKDISFNVEKGEIVGFLGPNGAGKTTTMKILTCYMPPTSGTAIVTGYDIHENSLEIRKNIGYLPESNPLYPEMGVIEWLDFMSRIHEIPEDTRASRIKKVVEECGLGDVIHKDIGELSRGYKQRLGFAHSILHDPKILILDEPTAGLDPNQAVEIRNLIKELGKEKTVLLSTHILSEVQSTCNRVIIINKGMIVADNKTSEIYNIVQQKETLLVQIKAPSEMVSKALTQLQGVEKVDLTGSGAENVSTFEIQASAGMDLRESVFNAAVKNKWVILEMQRKLASLEDIFRHLTIESENTNET